MKLLCVCLANICRSPLAEGLISAAAKRVGKSAVTVSSAGVLAAVNIPADPRSLTFAKGRMIDLSAHKSQRLTARQMQEADLALVMDQALLAELVRLYPQAKAKTFLLRHWIDKMDIEDPISAEPEKYAQIAASIDEAVETWVERL